MGRPAAAVTEINHNEQAKQATALVFGQVFASLAEALAPIIMVRYLSMTDVGILSAILLVYTLLAPVFASAFPHTLIYYLPTRTLGERQAIAIKVAGIMFFFGLLAAIFMFALGLLALLAPVFLAGVTDTLVGGVSAIGPAGLKYLVVLALMPLGDFPVRMLANLLVVEGRARTAAVVNALKSLFTLSCLLVPILMEADLWTIITSYSLAGFLSGFLLLFYLRRLYPGRPGTGIVNRVSVRQLCTFALPMGINETVMMLYNRIDLFLIALVFPAVMVAQYRTGAWQVPFVTSVAYSVGAVYVPHLRRLFDAGLMGEAVDIWKGTICKVALITVPLGLICVAGAEEIVSLLFTDQYLPAANVFRLYCLLTLGRVAAFGPVLVAAGRPRLIIRVAILSFLGNIIFSVPLVFTLGFIGPALGTLLAFIIHVAAFCWCIAEATRLPFSTVFPLRRYLHIVATGLVGVGPALLVKLYGELSDGWTLAVMAVIIIGVFSLCASHRGYITRCDWKFIARLVFPGILVRR